MRRVVVLAIALGAAAVASSGQSLQLVISGHCPGDEIVTVAGASPGGLLELYASPSKGAGTVPSGACAGTELDLEDPRLVGVGAADGDGSFSLTVPAPEAVCGVLLQTVDLATCETGGVAHLETGRPGAVPRTGQTESFAAGDDGDLQKGVAWPGLRFIDNGDGTVSDTLTGLVWLQTVTCFEHITWGPAMDAAAGLEDGECGLTDGSAPGDWRLPSAREFKSVIDTSQEFPALPLGHPFTGTDSFSVYVWTSTTDTLINSRAWVVEPTFGWLLLMSKTDGVVCSFETCGLWPIRDGG